MDQGFWQTIPEEFESEVYRSLHSDLALLTEAELLEHYSRFGRREGRVANSLRDRNGFVGLIPGDATVLEIGPFCNPLVRDGPNVYYFDVLSHEGLSDRARSSGLDPSGIPPIHYVSPTGDLSIIDRRFDVIISSHCLEHQPDLIGHLQGVERVLSPEGAYFLLLPDKRYCFDHFIPPSNLAEIVVAHNERRKLHTQRSVIEHFALTTHNDSLRHWHGDHGEMFDNLEHRMYAAEQAFNNAGCKYVDVHAWYFTPNSACALLGVLHKMAITQLKVHRVYPTRFGANEFWLILRPAPIMPADFDTDRYLALNPDVAAAGADPARHWREYGHLEGRQWK